MTIRGRYAPSPTGFLHLCNARTALVAYLLAKYQPKYQQGEFIMRIEDIDLQRCKPEFQEANLEELRWLGLDWDEGPDVGGSYAPYIQRERFAFYETMLAELTEAGQTFPCYLSRKDIQELASAPHEGLPSYGIVQRLENERLTPEKQAEGKQSSIRLKTTEKVIEFEDKFLGQQSLNLSTLGDVVLRRADGTWAYHLAVVTDDIAMNINQVVRGDDLLGSTATHLYLYELFDAPVPDYWHVPLLLDTDGKRMAKRKGSLTLKSLQDAGVNSEKVIGLLAYTLGLIDSLKAMSVNELLDNFNSEDLDKDAYQLTTDDLSFLDL